MVTRNVIYILHTKTKNQLVSIYIQLMANTTQLRNMGSCIVTA